MQISKMSALLRDKFTLVAWDDTLYYRDATTKLYKVPDKIFGGLISSVEGLEDLKPTEQQALLDYTLQKIEAESYLGELPVYSEMPSRYTAFEGGVLDWETGRVIDYTDDMIFLSRVGHRYVPDAEPVEVVDKFMRDLSFCRPEVETLLYEAIGYALYRSIRFRTAFILVGPPGCGKSTYLKQVEYLMGKGTYSSLGLSDIGSEYKTCQLCGMLANIGDDISDKYIDDNSVLKKVISGEAITANVKYGLPLTFRPYATCFFASNNLPRMRDAGGAMADRLITIPCSNTFDKSERDHFLEEKLRDEKAVEYMISRAVKAFMGVLARNEFTETADTKQVSEQWALDNNPILSFLMDYKEKMGVDTLAGVYCDELYDEWRAWIEKMNVKSDYTINSFRRAVETADPSVVSGASSDRVRSRMKKYGEKTYRFQLRKQGRDQPRAEIEVIKAPAPEVKKAPVAIPDDEKLELFDDVPF